MQRHVTFAIADNRGWEQIWGMIPNPGFRLVLALVVSFISVSAFGDEPADKQAGNKHVRVVQKENKNCTVRFGGSAFPQPCDRLAEMPATAEPMHIIGILPKPKQTR